MTKSEQILMDGMRRENERLKATVTRLREGRVTHYCATCEKLALENHCLEAALDVAVKGLGDLRDMVRQLGGNPT